MKNKPVMKKTPTAALLTILLVCALAQQNLQAQEDGSQVILPLEAQNCQLPTAPAKIPSEASYDDLVTAKGNVTRFQGELASYRECLTASETADALTQGNRMALTQAHNYSVEMEERVAEQFNVAVRAYKAREAGEG